MVKYLIVGIDYYYNNNLPTTIGAVNSAQKWEKIIKGQTSQGKILLNREAQSKDIKKELLKLVESLAEGDNGVFIYIGHGGKMFALADDKQEIGLDEVLYPYFGYIRDNEIRQILDKNTKNIPFLMMLDCCQNGVIEGLLQQDENKNEIVISASRNDQYSRLDTIESERQTVFSYYAQKIITENLSTTYLDFMLKFYEQISNTNYIQRPQIIVSNLELFMSTFLSSTLQQLTKEDYEKITKIIKDNPDFGLGIFFTSLKIDLINTESIKMNALDAIKNNKFNTIKL